MHDISDNNWVVNRKKSTPKNQSHYNLCVFVNPAKKVDAEPIRITIRLGDDSTRLLMSYVLQHAWYLFIMNLDTAFEP